MAAVLVEQRHSVALEVHPRRRRVDGRACGMRTQVEINGPKMGQIGGQVGPLAIYEHPRVSPTPQ